MAVVIAVHGPSGSGKTTLIERLVPRLQARGLRVGVIKHTHHAVEPDERGKDSWRMWQAGAQAVVLAGPQDLLLRTRGPSTVDEALALMPKPLDCLFVEGFTQELTTPTLRLGVSPEGVRFNGTLHSRDDVEALERAIVAIAQRPAAPLRSEPCP